MTPRFPSPHRPRSRPDSGSTVPRPHRDPRAGLAGDDLPGPSRDSVAGHEARVAAGRDQVSALAAHWPHAGRRSEAPFFETLIAGGTLVLRDDKPREIITGSAAQLHRVNQAPRRFASRRGVRRLHDRSTRSCSSAFVWRRPASLASSGSCWSTRPSAVIEFGTQVLALLARHQTAGGVCQRQLLRAVRRRAERATVGALARDAHAGQIGPRQPAERTARVLPGDERIPQAIDTLTHGVTIRRAPRDVWPWLVQMGAGSRAGWYSYDWLDNGRQPSATRIVPELQHPAIGTVFPALPGVTDGFIVLAIEPERVLTLGWPAPDGTLEVTWTFVLEEAAPGVTRLLVRARGGPGYRFHGLPLLLTRLVVRVVHFVMQRKQLLGIARRAEMTMSQHICVQDTCR